MWVTVAAAGLRTLILIWLTWCYYRVKGADLNTVIRDMERGRIQSRRFWSKAEMLWLLSTMLLVVWYGFMFLIISAAHFRQNDTREATMMTIYAFFMGLLHFFIWKDALENFEDPDEADQSDLRMKELYKLYRTKKIELHQYDEVVKTNENTSEVCCVCLDDFSSKDEVVQLPCGHVFHPLCSHIWICSHWTCPLRCELGMFDAQKTDQRREGSPPVQGSAAPPQNASSHAVPSASVVSLEDDIEQGLASTEVVLAIDDSSGPEPETLGHSLEPPSGGLSMSDLEEEDLEAALPADHFEEQQQRGVTPAPEPPQEEAGHVEHS
jgi:hypothetical protein